MPIRTVGEYLKRWGFRPQKPFRKAYEQKPAAVKKWLDEEYPAIKARVRKEGGEVQWGDETGLVNCCCGRSYAPRGRILGIRISAKRGKISLISSISNQGKVRFMVYKDAMNAQIPIKFVKRLIRIRTERYF